MVLKKKMNRGRRPPSNGVCNYQCGLLFLTFLMIAAVVISVSIALSIQPSTVKNVLILPRTYPPTTPVSTTTVTTVTAATTAPLSTTTPPSTTAATTTPIPTLTITCPPNITVVLGASLLPQDTGGTPSTTGGCTSPIVQYNDSVTNTSVTKRTTFDLPPPMHEVSERIGLEMASIYLGSDLKPVMATTPQESRLMQRSPSFASGNLVIQGTPAAVSNTGFFCFCVFVFLK